MAGVKAKGGWPVPRCGQTSRVTELLVMARLQAGRRGSRAAPGRGRGSRRTRPSALAPRGGVPECTPVGFCGAGDCRRSEGTHGLPTSRQDVAAPIWLPTVDVFRTADEPVGALNRPPQVVGRRLLSPDSLVPGSASQGYGTRSGRRGCLLLPAGPPPLVPEYPPDRGRRSPRCQCSLPRSPPV